MHRQIRGRDVKLKNKVGVKRKIKTSNGQIRIVRIKHLKKFIKTHKKNKSGEYVLFKKYRRKKKVGIGATPIDQEIEVWELEGQHTYQAKTGTDFAYNLKGIFENQPTPEKIEKMINNSLAPAFRDSARKGKYRKVATKLYNEMTRGAVKGFTLEKKKIKKSQAQKIITNKLDSEFIIKSGGREWRGTNSHKE